MSVPLTNLMHDPTKLDIDFFYKYTIKQHKSTILSSKVNKRYSCVYQLPFIYLYNNK